MKNSRREIGAKRGQGLGRSPSAFTMVELLVAMAILAILAVFLVQMTSATGQATQASSQAVDAASQSRLVFDRIGLDLAGLLMREDADFVAVDPSRPVSGEPEGRLLFLSRVISPGATRQLSLLAYRLDTHSDNVDGNKTARLCLQRAGIPLPWTRPSGWGSTFYMGFKADGLPVRLNTTDPDFVRSILPAESDFDVLAPGVLQMVVGYQLYPDNQPVTLKDTTTVANALGQIVYSPPMRGSAADPAGACIDLSRVSAIVVGVVALDVRTLRSLSAADATTLSEAFHLAAPAAGQLPLETWTPKIAALIGEGAGPLPVRQGLRAYQRFFPINPYASPAL